MTGYGNYGNILSVLERGGCSVGLFVKRPLCFFCCLFVLFSLFARGVGRSLLLYAVGLILLGMAVLIFHWHIAVRHRIHILFCLLCVGAILLAVVHSLLTVVLPTERAKKWEGDRGVLFQILSVEYQEKDSVEYKGAVTEIDGERVRIPASLTCDFSSDAAVGDRLYVYGSVCAVNEKSDGEVLLNIFAEKEEYAYVQRLSQSLTVPELLFSRGGLRILGARMGSSVGDLLSQRLDAEIGALASGFLVGDRADLSAEVIRDFRRAGVSHVMAVSGQHFTILLGGLELLLRRLFCTRSVRCGIVSVCGLVFLMLTGFSLSACRALLMLFAVYLHYFLSEENDSVTALFASFAAIVFVSPSAASDLGLWMSFLATLGLITIYPILEKRIPYPRSKQAVSGRVFRFLRSVLLVAAMTVVAEIFLLPVQWGFFGEFSLVSLLCNVILSPLVVLFLYGILFCLALGGAPFVGETICVLLQGLGEGIISAVGWFSRLPGATVSLKYGFCTVIMILYIIAMLIILLIPLKRKWILWLPSATAVVSFVICFTVTRLFFSAPVAFYNTDGKGNEWISVESGGSLSICDISNGGNDMYYQLYDTLDQSTATEIDALILTHYHKGHRSMVTPLLKKAVVRRLYLPIPKNKEELSVAARLSEGSLDCKTQVIFYSSGEKMELAGQVFVQVGYESDEEHVRSALRIATSEGSISYGGVEVLKSGTGAFLWESETLLLGSHGQRSTFITTSVPNNAKIERIIYTDRKLISVYQLIWDQEEYYVYREEQKNYRAEFPLS